MAKEENLVKILQSSYDRVFHRELTRLEMKFKWLPDPDGIVPKKKTIKPMRDERQRQQALAITEQWLREVFEFRCRLIQETSYKHRQTIEVRETIAEEMEAQSRRRAALDEALADYGSRPDVELD
jgi:hypothetical protein